LKKEAKSEKAHSFGKFEARQKGFINGDSFLIALLSSIRFAIITPKVMRVAAVTK
jgi:hypothetical protein